MSGGTKIVVAVWVACFVIWMGLLVFLSKHIRTEEYAVSEFPNSAISDNIFTVGDDGESYIVLNSDSKNVLKKYPKSSTEFSQTLTENETPYAEVELYGNGDIKGVTVYLPCDMGVKFEQNLENVYILKD